MSQKVMIESRHLIFSTDRETWKFDQPVLFMGKWCLRQKDKKLWEKMDARIAEPIGKRSNLRFELFQKARKVEENLFSVMVEILNNHHQTHYNERYWKIVLGPWFREAIDLLINRLETVEECFKNNNIASITTYNFAGSTLSTQNYTDATNKANDDYWNTQLFTRIIELSEFTNLSIELLETPKSSSTNSDDFRINISVRISLKQRLYLKIRKLLERFARSNDAVIVNSYLPLQKEFLLSLALKQIPQWRATVEYESSKEINEHLRVNLGAKMQQSTNSEIEKILSVLLFETIPTYYLEEYEKIVETTKNLTWPKNPKFIFTSNNFVSDDIFKIWVAEKVTRGTPYFAGQHGNNYGTSKYLGSTIEETTSDKFLTWGWKGGLPQHLPAFIFKNVSKVKRNTQKTNNLLLIENLLIPRLKVWEQADEFENYMEEQFKFVRSLKQVTRTSLSVRLHVAHDRMQGEEVIRWNNFDPKIKIDFGARPIRDLWPESRIVVHSYDSTGLLETLEANIPTIAFWQNGLDHLVQEAIPLYMHLLDVGIVHLTPESAANRVNEIWHDVDSWWWSHEVQIARTEFCSQYARSSRKPIRELKNILLDSI